MTFKNIGLALALLFLSAGIFAQTNDTNNYQHKKKSIKYLDVRVENGAMLGNGFEVADQLAQSSYYNGVDIRLGFRMSDPNDLYSNVYRRPYFGVGWYSSTFHQAEIGEPNALYFFLTIPFAFEKLKKWTFSYSGAFGLSYNFNPYDSLSNPANIFVGSYRNCYVHLALTVNYKFNEKWALNGSIGFKHFSNGSFKLPNYGINLIPVTLGVSYKLSKENIHQFKKPIPNYLKHNLVNISFMAGSKNYEVGGDNYLKAALSVNFLRQVSYKYRIGLGLDLFYAAGAPLRIDSDASDFSKSYSYAIVGSWEWVLTKRLYVPLGIGIYLHRNIENNELTPFYERAGIRYRLSKHIHAGLTIKAHKGVADFFEWTVGYTFHHDPNE